MRMHIVEWTANAGFELAVEIGEVPACGEMDSQMHRGSDRRHGSRGERSGFVAAKHVQAAEVLNRGEMLDDDFLAGHGDGAFGKRHRCDHG